MPRRRVEDGLAFLRGEDLDHKVNDVARGAKLPGIALRTEDAKQILKGIAEPFAVIVAELVDDFEEGLERLRVAVWKVGVLEVSRKSAGDTGWVLGHLGNAFAVKAEHLVAAERGSHQFGPPVAGIVSGEELALAAEFFGLGVHVIHELVDQRDGDLLDLGFWVGDLADEDVAGGVDAAFGIGVEH